MASLCDDPTAMHEEGLASCKLRPTVLFAIADHFTRRQDEQGRVIGTLLGSVNDGVVDIVNSFPVPHSETEQATIDSDFNSTMYGLHRKVHPKQVVIGWYSTGAELTHNDQFYHQYFEEQVPEGVTPVLLLVDMSFTGAGVKTKAFVRSELSLGGKHVASAFKNVRLRVAKSEAERIGVDHIIRSSMAGGDGPQELVPLRAEVDTNHWRMCKLLDAVDKMRAYIEQVESGKLAPNPAIGRALADALASIPKPDSGEFNQMLDSNSQVHSMARARWLVVVDQATRCARAAQRTARRSPPVPPPWLVCHALFALCTHLHYRTCSWWATSRASRARNWRSLKSSARCSRSETSVSESAAGRQLTASGPPQGQTSRGRCVGPLLGLLGAEGS